MEIGGLRKTQLSVGSKEQEALPVTDFAPLDLQDEGSPATRLTSLCLQNSTNMSGVRLQPSQLKVVMLAP